MTTDATELKKLVKDLQSASTHEEIIDILTLLKKNVVATEALLRESKAGLAVGKLRAHATKDVSDLAKELVKKWKTEVEKAKQAAGNAASNTHASTPSSPAVNGKSPAVRKSSAAVSSPQTPTSPSTAWKNQLGVPRTTKTDGVNVDFTGDKTRDKCIELLYDALASDSGAHNEVIIKRAKGIEQTVLDEFHRNMGKEYKAKIRSLYLNLKDKNNPGLRESIVSGEIDVAKLCKMSSQDMASEERKAADRKIQAENLHKSLGAGEQQAETEAFQCSRCKQRKTRYRQAQTRSADEPMTTFVTCVNCNNRWKFS